MRIPSINTLSDVFDNPKRARRALERMRIDDAMQLLGHDDGIFGVESIETTSGEYADYLNTGDIYNATLILWRGNLRVQTLGDFIEIMERRSIRFE